MNQENAPLLPIMLASKELPEMEEEEASLLEKHRLASIGVPVGTQYEHLSVRPGLSPAGPPVPYVIPDVVPAPS